VIEGDIRREKIIEIMSNQKEPVSGSDLAKKFGEPSGDRAGYCSFACYQ
jgi:transcriptional regulator of NAD metabolism